MGRRGRWVGALVVTLGIAATACRPDEPALDGQLPDTSPPLGEVAPGAAADPAANRAEADEVDRTAMELRTHILRMRAATTPSIRANLAGHREQLQAVAQSVRGADAAAREGRGIRTDHLDLARSELAAAEAEMTELERAAEPAIQDRMPAHLDRLERLASALEAHAAELRR